MKELQPAVTVIVAVYNTALWLPLLLESLAAQTLQSLQIILVDDGSSDHSPVILAEFAAVHANVILLRQENRGVYAARNMGLKAATGEYIAFADSDDVVHPTMYEALYAAAKRDQLDLITSNAWHVEVTGERALVHPVLHGFDRPQPAMAWYEGALQCVGDAFWHVMWTSLYRRAWLDAQGHRFVEGRSLCDTIWMARCYATAKRFCFYDQPLYDYIHRKNSLCRDYSSDRDLREIAARTLVLRELGKLSREPSMKLGTSRIFSQFMADWGLGVFHKQRRIRDVASRKLALAMIREGDFLEILQTHCRIAGRSKSLAWRRIKMWF